MKTLLIIDANLGQARAYMAKTLLERRHRKHIWKLLIIRMMPNWQLFWAIRFLPTVR